jgi:GTPase SAR1 family protein
MNLEVTEHIKPDIADLDKDEFLASIEKANTVYLLFDLTERKTLDCLMKKVGPWILEAKECSAQFVLVGTNCEERMRRLVKNEKEGLFTTSRAVLLDKYNKHS